MNGAALKAGYLRVRAEVRGHAQAWQEVLKVCGEFQAPAFGGGMPADANRLAVWQAGHDKPCFSNIRTDIGEKMQRELREGPFARQFADYQTIAGFDWELRFSKNDKLHWKKTSNYEARGKELGAFLGAYGNNKGLASYLWRFHAIRGFALALRDDVRMHRLIDRLAEAARQPAGVRAMLAPWVREFAACAGRGWGITTVYHLLADLGVAVKPDVHVHRSLARLGWMPNKSGKTIDEMPPPTASEQHDIVRILLGLSGQVSPTACPKQSANGLREMDKVLMEWDRQGLARSA